MVKPQYQNPAQRCAMEMQTQKGSSAKVTTKNEYCGLSQSLQLAQNGPDALCANLSILAANLALQTLN